MGPSQLANANVCAGGNAAAQSGRAFLHDVCDCAISMLGCSFLAPFAPGTTGNVPLPVPVEANARSGTFDSHREEVR